MIYFVRHGQTDYNLKKIYAGQKDIPLNKEGINQAKKTALKLKDISFDICYCSPLKGAKQTLEEIIKLNSKTFPVIYDDRLKERDYGKLVDKPVGSEPFNRWKIGVDEEINQKYEIETIPNVYNRIKSFFDEILKNHYKNILIVAHSGVGRVTSAYFNGMPKDQDLSNIKISNAEVLIFNNNQ